MFHHVTAEINEILWPTSFHKYLNSLYKISTHSRLFYVSLPGQILNPPKNNHKLHNFSTHFWEQIQIASTFFRSKKLVFSNQFFICTGLEIPRHPAVKAIWILINLFHVPVFIRVHFAHLLIKNMAESLYIHQLRLQAPQKQCQ